MIVLSAIWAVPIVPPKESKDTSTIFVDFSPKGGPKDLLGVFDEVDGGIRWPDKNLWKKL